MSSSIAALMSNPELRGGLSNDALVVYLVLRADVESQGTSTARAERDKNNLICGLDVQTIAQRSNMPALTVKRLLADLNRRKWVRFIDKFGAPVYLLGHCDGETASWFVDCKEKKPENADPSTLSPALQRIVERIQEQKKRAAAEKLIPKMSRETKQKLAASVLQKHTHPRGTSKAVFEHYIDVFQKKYRRLPVGITRTEAAKPSAKTYVLVGRLIEWAGGAEEAKQLISWYVSSWDTIKTARLMTGDAGLSLLCTKGFFVQVCDWKRTGVISMKMDKPARENPGKRAETSDLEGSKDVGW